MLRKAFFNCNILPLICAVLSLALGFTSLLSEAGPEQRTFFETLVTWLFILIAFLLIFRAAAWLAYAAKLEEREPDLKRGLLESAEKSYEGLYFLFGDRLITLRRPKIIYYSDIVSVHRRHYRQKRGGQFNITISDKDGKKHLLVFYHGRRSDKQRALADTQEIISYIVTRNPQAEFTDSGI